jgi:cysteinyl-tRNA synthetase
MGLRLHNTLTRTKEDFVPIDPQNIRMYVCGPTVYDFAHIGNARPLIVFDVLFRLLRHLYGPEHVTYVRNITDVDDKINARAAEEYPDLPLNEAIRAVTSRTEKQFHEDVAALGCLPPTFEPRATEFISRPDQPEDMIRLIARLIANGNAYPAEGHVLFDVKSWKGSDGSLEYGKLSNRSLDEMIAGARVEIAPYKRDPMDFVLWKPSKPGEPSWPSPWGAGRPGWHIECSAMAGALLGPTFDIHGGGIDLVFPHHENEIAQSRSAHGTELMAKYWMHNGFLQVEGEKMSKSLGNFVTIRELLRTQEFGGRVWPGEVLRLAMLMTHYRQPIDWTADRLQEAQGKLTRWFGTPASRGVPEQGRVVLSVTEALEDDLNTVAILPTLDDLASAVRSTRAPRDAANDLAATMRWLGISKDEDYAEARANSEDLRSEIRAAILGVDKDRVLNSISARATARRAKNFAEADRIRVELEAMGIALKDAKDPTTGELVTTWEVKR